MTGERGRQHRRGALTDDDLAVWRAATRDVTPRDPDHVPPAPARPESASESDETPKAGPQPGQPARRRQGGGQTPLRVGELAGVDRRTAERLRRGRLPIEAKLDLHGMTRADAHTALAGFVQRCAGRGNRCVLVITGKGGPSGEGVLRNDLPRWLNEPPVRACVVACTPARQRHGGGGAFYLLLRRNRA